MGRYGTGAINVRAAQRLELRWLRKQLYFKCFGQNFELYGYHKQVITWTDGNKIDIEVRNTKTGLYLILSYTIITRSSEQIYMNYKVQIERVPSNLGAGEVLYFRCPVSNNRCRILYRVYGSHYFKSMKAYKTRIYYPVQMASKNYLLLERRNIALDKYKALPGTRKQTTFKGKPTKRFIKKEALHDKYIELEDLADEYWIKTYLRKR